MLVNLLSDQEMDLIGVSWKEYQKIATKLEIAVIRIPTEEGKAPNSLTEVHDLMKRLDVLQNSFLVHCRGGIGRFSIRNKLTPGLG